MQIFGIFSHPVVLFEYPKLELETYNYFRKEEENKIINTLNTSSQNDEVLDNPLSNPLKKRICESINKFKKNILSSEINLYITQSWLNFTEKKEAHHVHTHPNSIISGVYYYDVDNNDNISFENPCKFQYEFNPSIYNIFNSEQWTIPVRKNCLILFMSNLGHFVKQKKEEGTRRSLSFNTFFKPPFGIKHNKTFIK
jgi:uncharacterized protein (TIGR02466 family)